MSAKALFVPRRLSPIGAMGRLGRVVYWISAAVAAAILLLTTLAAVNGLIMMRQAGGHQQIAQQAISRPLTFEEFDRLPAPATTARSDYRSEGIPAQLGAAPYFYGLALIVYLLGRAVRYILANE